MVTTSHSETLSVDINSIVRVLNTFKTIYVRDKKEFLHYLILKNLYDITLTQPPYIQSYTQTHSHFYKLFPNKKNINRIIPIVKHYEYCEKTFETLKPRINEPINNFYNNKATVVFNAIERNGIRIDRKEFEPRFHNVDSDYVYGQFNFKTLTTRPSNRFKGVNYAAINKENGDRKPIIPNNHFLFELDISAYHPTLLSHLVGYEFDDGDIHQNFADMYKVDYQKAKELTFKQLYGGVFEQYKDLEFFKKVQKYTDELWAQFKGEGYVECPISKHIYRDDELQDMKPQKLLNYILQATETSTNVLILWEMFKLLKGCKTKLILYTYDSFTFDVDKSEKETIKKIIDIFEGFKLKVKMVSGSNYGEMN
jgi:DNA polymerase I-like protein with 3'-5' exonuclease and polymerase domains